MILFKVKNVVIVTGFKILKWNKDGFLHAVDFHFFKERKLLIKTLISKTIGNLRLNCCKIYVINNQNSSLQFILNFLSGIKVSYKIFLKNINI